MDILLLFWLMGKNNPKNPRNLVIGAASSDENLKEAWMRCLNLARIKKFPTHFRTISLPFSMPSN
jgi:hypothetical protein